MTNNNFLSPINFGFKLDRTPGISYTVQRIIIPGISLNTTDIPNPFIRIPLSGSMEFDDLQVTFKVDENMEGYLEILNWMISLGHPDSLDQFEDLKSDCTVGIYGSSRQPNITVKLTDLYPVALSSIELDTTLADVQYATVNATFRFQNLYFSVD